jgi:putative membrane protein
VLAILGTGAADALLVIFVPAYARIFLNTAHAESEVRHYTHSLFLRRGLCDTRGRNGILMLVSLFERRIEIYADKGHDGNIGEPQWRSVIAVMMPHLAVADTALALQDGLQRLEEILRENGVHAARGDKNELPDRPIEERGAK